MGTLYRRAYAIRRATPKWGIEITLPPEIVDNRGMKVGDEVDLLYDNFVLIVPKGTTVDEESLRRALAIPAGSPEEEEPEPRSALGRLGRRLSRITPFTSRPSSDS